MGSACRIVGCSIERRPGSDTVTTWPSALVDAELRASALVDNPESRAACGQTEEHPTTGQRDAPDGYPWGHADEPTGALGPRRRKPRTDTPGGHHREHPTTSAEGGVRDARTPASGTGCAVEHNRHCWYCCADARYWHRRALSTTCMGYQHRRALYPPRGVNSPLTMSTTPSRCRQRAPVRSAPLPCEPTGRIPRSGAPPPGLRTQGPRFTKHPMHTTA